MEIRHVRHAEEIERFNTQELRENFLIEDLFVKNKLNMVYTHEDRMVIGGAIPEDGALKLDDAGALKTEYFLERRELGVINIGEEGVVKADWNEYVLNKKDCVYIGKGTKEVVFESKVAVNPAKFYLVSALAHTTYPTRKIGINEATPAHMGDVKSSNKRTIYKYIHADGVQSCQLMLGMTLLEDNSLWNTMPPHLHDRRSEVYLYFDIADDAKVFHLMGKPDETRHIVIDNEQAVISPSWSIHSGVGTSGYTFIWAMAGENYTFNDMDAIEIDQLR